jgi:predicted TIM-barrel enzyme
VRDVREAVELPVAVGSGLTPDNLAAYWEAADVFIVGSFLKYDGVWQKEVDPDRAGAFVTAARGLSEAAGDA